jgi:homopolymeric O-antigen transport system ATP-binding protein
MSSPTAFEFRQETARRPSSDETIIDIDRVAVHYRVPRERIASFKAYAIDWLKRRISFDEFWALDEISLRVHRGEVVGIIGHNGAGKSTLLKLVARVIHPSRGRVRVRGRVAPLLELGAGFDFDLTGRENVFLNGMLLGFRRADLEARMERIVEFAGLGEFIDRPIRTYSTGMITRLGFAVATDVQPDILIIDEVLAVGDAEFQHKSAARLQQLVKSGEAVLMASHDLQVVRDMCHRVIWLDHGRLRAIGPTESVVDAYVEATET